MRIDHFAYQRANRVAGFGLLLQLVIGLTLFAFAQLTGDTAAMFASTYVLLGSVAWLSLILIFYQHKLERLEALEEDELAQGRSAESMFEAADEEIRVAARRLRLMHKWLMPIASLGLAAFLGLFATYMLFLLSKVEMGEAEFFRTELKGWGIAICLGFAAVGFIFSRFVAGMAKQNAWQNLRGGAGFMVGNVLVLLAVAVGITFRYFENDQINMVIAYAIPVFMIVAAIEIILNFILNLYRPRVPGEVPRPAFDSRLLSLLSAPDNIVRSLNEAVNYQFGFDITSSWGYQLLLRSLAGLAAIGIIVAITMNMIIVVEPQQQGIRLADATLEAEGSDVLGPGIHWKMPWPAQGVIIRDVTPIRTLPLTATTRSDQLKGNLWWVELETVEEIEPLLVLASEAVEIDEDSMEAQAAEGTRASLRYSLVDTEINLQYRIQNQNTGSGDGLHDYLMFASDEREPRGRFTERQKLLRALAQREVRRYFARQSYDRILAADRSTVARELESLIQDAYARTGTGVDVVSINIPVLRPHAEAAQTFVDLAISKQVRVQYVEEAQGTVDQSLAYLVGSPERAAELLAGIQTWEEMRDAEGSDPEAVAAQRQLVRDLLMGSEGAAAQIVRDAENERWVKLMASQTEANRMARELPAYRAAPMLYMEREIMQVFMDTLSDPEVRKFIVGVDPSRLNVAIEQETLGLLEFQDVLSDESTETGGEDQ